jgi:hypothetical protein
MHKKNFRNFQLKRDDMKKTLFVYQAISSLATLFRYRDFLTLSLLLFYSSVEAEKLRDSPSIYIRKKFR